MRFSGLLWFSLLSALAAAEVQVFVSGAEELQYIRARDLKSLFLMQVDRVEGIRLEVIEHPYDSNLRQVFAQEFLNMSPQQMKEYWLKRFITFGQIEPKVKRNCRAAFRYLSMHKGSIAYCDSDADLPSGVRPLEIRHY